jgi:hypothetical protein
MARERRERDRAAVSRALTVLLVAAPWAFVQLFAGLMALDAEQGGERDCDLRYDGDLLAAGAVFAAVLALLALVSAWPRPNLSIRLAAAAAFVSLCFLAAGGWSAAGCALG